MSSRSHLAPAGTRIYAIGDIHGRCDLLRELHRAVADDLLNCTAARRVMVYVGDYIDRGADSKSVIELILSRPLAGFETVCLAGNHEAMMLAFLDDGAVAAHDEVAVECAVFDGAGSEEFGGRAEIGAKLVQCRCGDKELLVRCRDQGAVEVAPIQQLAGLQVAGVDPLHSTLSKSLQLLEAVDVVRDGLRVDLDADRVELEQIALGERRLDSVRSGKREVDWKPDWKAMRLPSPLWRLPAGEGLEVVV